MASGGAHLAVNRSWTWRTALWAVILALLALPLVAMQFTREVNWAASDFAFAATLLLGAGAAFELSKRVVRGRRKRMAIGAFLLAAVLLIWAEGAVGLFR